MATRKVVMVPSAESLTELDRDQAALAPAEPSDEQLILAYGRGDAAAFATLLRRYQKPIYNFLLRHVGHPATAEDLLQEVFVRVIENSSGFRRDAKFKTWLYTIARNLCVDQARRAKHRRAASLDQAPGAEGEGADRATLGERLSDGSASVESQVAGKHLQQRIERALARLNPDQREVFLLREVGDLSFKEIAEVVGSAENTVKSRMRYALEALRRELADLHRDPPSAAGAGG